MDPYIGEIRMFAGTYAPEDWAFCNGQSLSVQDYGYLFGLIGTTYGGDGVTQFNLPNLSQRVPMHYGIGSSGTGYALGQMSGSATVTVTTSQIPAHVHTVTMPVNNSEGNTEDPTNAYLGNSGGSQYANKPTPDVFAGDAQTGSAGGGQPHANLQPSLGINFIIALASSYPNASSETSSNNAAAS